MATSVWLPARTSKRTRWGIIILAAWLHCKAWGSYICNLIAVLIEVIDYELPGQSGWQGWIQPFGSY